MNIPDRYKPGIALLLVVLIVLGLWSIIARLRAKNPNVIVRRLISSVATGTARETAKLLGNKGQIVLIGTVADPESRQAGLQREFKDEIKGYGSIRVIATEQVPDDQLVGDMYGCAIAEPFATALREKYRDADAIVSLAGLLLTDPDEPPSPERKPKIIALCWSLTGVKEQFAQKALDLAVVPRYQRPPPPDTGAPSRWFERDRQVVTAENVDTLPE